MPKPDDTTVALMALRLAERPLRKTLKHAVYDAASVLHDDAVVEDIAVAVALARAILAEVERTAPPKEGAEQCPTE